jgi:putative membrane protein
MMGGYGMTGGFGFGWVFMILWGVFIIVGIAALVKWLSAPTAAGECGDSERKALDILKERYARGEIDEQEFQKKKRDLSQ